MLSKAPLQALQSLRIRSNNSTLQIRAASAQDDGIILLLDGYQVDFPFRNRDLSVAHTTDFVVTVEGFGFEVDWSPVQKLLYLRLEPFWSKKVKG